MPITRILIALIPAFAVAAGNWVVAGLLAPATSCASCLAWLVGGPILLALFVAAVVSRVDKPLPNQPAVVPVPEHAPSPRESAEVPALRLLGMLQEEGRFVDFLQEDLAPYPDEQIGAAARGIHEGCRKAVREHLGLELEPVVQAAEGETVTVEPGFDPAAIRLTGNVCGAPPFRGVLRHTGWRVTRA
ncbi:MAG TPA: DUF2760 domain-containing protein, partial [Candidatus Binatia bacterium]|nr:DUF2760 domain-containing protein [Candidatus Binatia bacterium]